MNPFSHLKVAALSDVGKKRKNNEDAFGTFPESGLFCVADGMGGGDDGEIASAAVIRAVEQTVAILKPNGVGGFAARDVGAVLAQELSKASAWICHRAREHRLNGCGSTFVGVVFDPTDPEKALAVHAGDSRLYRLRGRSIVQITRDHSVAELMGEKDESKVNPMFRSMVVNGIGIRSKADPEFTPFEIAAGDRILVCSDGLSRMVPDKKILALSRAAEEPTAAVRSLIAAALEAGGVDNVTAVLVEVGQLPPPVLRLEPPPIPESPSEAATADDVTTDGGATGATGGTATGATQLPDIAEESPFGIEASADDSPDNGVASIGGSVSDGDELREKDTETAEEDSMAAVPARRNRLVWVVTGCLVALAAFVIAVVAGRRGAVRDSGESVAAEAGRNDGPIAAEIPQPQAAEPELMPRETSPAGCDAAGKAQPQTDAAPLPQERVPVAAAETNAVSISVTNVVPVSPPAVRPATDPVVADFAEACRDRSVQAFVGALRRLGPKDGLELDFDAEADRFRESARQLVRKHGAREAEAAAVDLRVLLLNAEPVRMVLAARRTEAVAAGILAAWNTVLSGDPSQSVVQRACVRLVKAMPEVRVR